MFTHQSNCQQQVQKTCIEKINKTKSRQKEGQSFKINKALKLVSIKLEDKKKEMKQRHIFTVSFKFDKTILICVDKKNP